MAQAARTDIEMKRSFGVGGAVVLGALMLGTGCSKNVEAAADSGASTGDVAEYYPLAVGNRWTYRLNGREDKEVTVEILKEEAGVFHDNQGGQLFLDGYGLRDPKRYLLRGPLKEGHAWTNVVSVSSTERYRIVQAGESCQTLAGTFPRCVQVEARNRMDAKATMVNTMTFAPGVGVVRIETVVEANGQLVPQTLLELTAWQLRDGAAPPSG
ncbi:hypothetical protein [Corallococcus macrosporus]|uniref:Putative lipoprotein n=1 Tax=Myxococcus fulvus (strain ATCC BAA-855 / HW-1) TaxID=483219 RepID=F8CKB0_MYXFH|nr:hypothetical protein [Corallococcus macrosporus]AEI67666.1 putative lipoprotein [Corallococcus macrosporus]